jgi:hypothetical protein
MQLTGYFSEFSWSDLLRFLDQTQTTGRLIIQTPPSVSSHKEKTYYLWINQGTLVAAATQLDSRGLLWLIHQQGWLTFRTVHRLSQACPDCLPLGTFLKLQGALKSEQLQHLFQLQIIDLLHKISQTTVGHFSFNSAEPLLYMEMTGLHLPLYEVELSTIFQPTAYTTTVDLNLDSKESTKTQRAKLATAC